MVLGNYLSMIWIWVSLSYQRFHWLQSNSKHTMSVQLMDSVRFARKTFHVVMNNNVCSTPTTALMRSGNICVLVTSVILFMHSQYRYCVISFAVIGIAI